MKVAADLGQAFKLAHGTDCKECFVIGGGEIYALAMPLADRVYLTLRVHAVLEGDTYFPVIDEKTWEMVSHLDFPADEKHVYAYSFQVWEPKGRAAGDQRSMKRKLERGVREILTSKQTIVWRKPNQ